MLLGQLFKQGLRAQNYMHSLIIATIREIPKLSEQFYDERNPRQTAMFMEDIILVIYDWELIRALVYYNFFRFYITLEEKTFRFEIAKSHHILVIIVVFLVLLLQKALDSSVQHGLFNIFNDMVLGYMLRVTREIPF